MAQIFISYRRGDTSAHAGRLYDGLTNRFGDDNVFMDVDTIEPGADFVDLIQGAVGQCDVFIAVIGRDWLGEKPAGGSRIEDPEDFVRLELAASLERDIRVIPVLVEGAEMPSSSQLPEPLAKLARRHALELSDIRWRHDVQRLIDTIEKVLKTRDTAPVLEEAAQQQQAEAGRAQAAAPQPAAAAPQPAPAQQHAFPPPQPAAPAATPGKDPAKRRSTQASISLALGIASVLLMFIAIGIFFGLPGLILGRLAQVNADPQSEKGTRARGAWGFWLGIIGSVGTVLFWILAVALA